MNPQLATVIGSQLLFTAGDLLARKHIKGDFTLANLLTGWFGAYVLLRTFATLGQLYVLSVIDLGKAMALFGAASVMIANLLGWLVLEEVLTPTAYVGIGLAVLALLVMSSR
jgi:uncharacterized membrane protein